MTSPTNDTVLILGGSGRFGRHATSAFAYHGWEVRQFDRAHDSLWDAAWGAKVIVNAWNPAYPDWATDLPRMTAEVIEVAKVSGATVLLPGNVYGYGPKAGPIWNEATPHLAKNLMGRLRVDMENAYKEAGVRTIILRCGDFIDTEQSGNWFDRIMISKLRRGHFVYPGATDVRHAWAWLPDVADAAVALAECRDSLPDFTDVPFEGYTLTATEMRQSIENVLGRPIKISKMNWLPLRVLAPFWKMAARLNEMRWLWNHPHQLDGTRLAELAPNLRATPVEEALSLALKLHIHPNQPVTAGTLRLTTE